MAEPPTSWDQADDENSEASLAAAKLHKLNVNATEFVPTFGSGGGFSFTPKAATVPQQTVPKTPPSSPVVNQSIKEEEKNQTEPVSKPNEVNVQQPVKEPVTTTTTVSEGEFDDIPDEDIES